MRAHRPQPAARRRRPPMWRILGASALLWGLAGCGPATAPRVASLLDDTVADPFAGVGRPTLQLYAVLSDDPQAMQGPEDVAQMWLTVGGQGPEASAIRRQVEWVPGDYRLNIDLDFADLPHPKVPQKAFDALARQLPAPLAARARAAKLAIFFRSDAGLLPGSDHLRLVGLSALHAAQRFDGVIYDLIARRAWRPADFARALAAPELNLSEHTRTQRRPDGAQALWLFTRGEPRWGRPDLQLRRVPEGQAAPAERLLEAARHAAAALPEPLQPGQTLQTPEGPVATRACEAPAGLHDAACVQLDWPR